MRFRHPQRVVSLTPRLFERRENGFGFCEMAIRGHLALLGLLGCNLCSLDLGFGWLLLGVLSLTLTLDPVLSGCGTFVC